jgi:transcriptional regulator with XRE-family HTH domain
MNDTELRAALAGLHLSQADFARLLGVTPRAVAMWISGERAVPPPAAAYLRFFAAAPVSVRQTELQRLKEGGMTMRDGIYLVFYHSTDTGQRLDGFGVVMFDNGKVYGGDPIGGEYTGHYTFDDASGRAHVRVTLSFPPNAPAVFGPSLPVQWSVEASCDLNPLADGLTRLTTTHGATVDVHFQFVRAMPEAA